MRTRTVSRGLRTGGNRLSDAERKAVAEADECLRHNQPIPHEQVLAEFGLAMADWKKVAASTDS
jgi:hypothetical protein